MVIPFRCFILANLDLLCSVMDENMDFIVVGTLIGLNGTVYDRSKIRFLFSEEKLTKTDNIMLSVSVYREFGK